MNETDKELTLEESVHQVMETLPPFIQEYLRQGKYTPVVQALMAKYGLRVDQGGVLEREVMLLLMGVENPVEFMDALKEEAHLEQATINNIVQDVNTQIFVPLRKEEEAKRVVPATPRPIAPPVLQPVRPVIPTAMPHKTTEEVWVTKLPTTSPVAQALRPITPTYTPPVRPVAPTAPVAAQLVRPLVQPAVSKPVAVVAPRITPAPPPLPPHDELVLPKPAPVRPVLGHLENKIPLPASAPLPPKLVMPFVPAPQKLPMPRPTPSFGEVRPKVNLLAPQRQIDESHLLEDHEEPHIDFNRVATAVPVRSSAPLEPQPAPRVAPVQVAEEPIAPPPPAPAPTMPLRSIALLTPAPAPVPSYANDPYRETIDELPAP